MKYDNQLRYAVKILQSFKGEMPFHSWMKIFFRENRQMGSSDRKQVNEMCYCFFRLGHALSQNEKEERIFAGLFLCNDASTALLKYFRPSLDKQVHENIADKLRITALNFPGFSTDRIFPWKEALSDGIDHQAFCLSFLKQPDLFIRIRPGHEESAVKKLTDQSVPFTQVSANCLSFANATRLDSILDTDREAVIQDLSSQQTGIFFKGQTADPVSAWDCCAASGGKSILLHDRYPAIKLTVSDIRRSILQNLENRFARAGIKQYRSFVADLSTNKPPDKEQYDLIIADLPCTGSGTWARTPDALCYYDERTVASYRSLQQKILSQVIPSLKKGGSLVYITCSVFKEENEGVANYIKDSFALQPIMQQLIRGYDKKADTMFAMAAG